jgi:zinc protease
MRRITLAFLIFAIAASTAGNLSAQSGRLPKVAIKEYKLKNGLRVVLQPDDSTPVVAVNVWYHVGSKNESPGKTGFAHLFEHMMFQGSKNFEDNYTKPLDEAGALINGTTDEDRTFYFEVVPSNFLELALFLEADRMGNLLGAMSQEKLDNQRDVVKNERRQRVDNQPYGTSFERIGAIMYPDGHPYHWPVIGSMEDLSAASLDDVKAFFRQYYVPNNAILVLSGKFDEKQTKEWVEKYFGAIGRGADISRPNPQQPKLTGEIRKTYEDAVPLPRLAMVWHGTPAYSRDEAALDILSSILSQGRGSRLQSSLVYGKELAQTVFANNSTNELAGTFQITATAKSKDQALEGIEAGILAETQKIQMTPPTDAEMARALNAFEAQRIFGLQTVFGKGSRIAGYAGYLGKPDSFQADLDRYRKVTAADIQRVAKTYLTENRLVMAYVPQKTPAAPAASEANKPTSTNAKKKDEARLAQQRENLPKPGPIPAFNLPPIEKTKLSNGLEVWIVRQNELPIVSMNLVIRSGATFEPRDKAGVASFTANMLNQGTASRSASEISNQLQDIGASVAAVAGWDSTNATLQSLTKNLDKALDIYADLVVNPAFPASEFDIAKRRAMVGFRQRRANPAIVSDVVYNKVLYGDQPYGRQLAGDEKSVTALTREDLVGFYAANYVPNNATLVVVGDVDARSVTAKLERAFSGWKAGSLQPEIAVSTNMIAAPGIYLVDKPGAAQSSVSIGQVGAARNNPDYYAIQVMNSILGGGGSARLFMNLREDKGYTYGAYSRFTYRRGAGPFAASGEIQTGSTKESIVEFLKELNGIRGAIPVSQAELENNKQSLIRRFPGGFETVGAISAQLASLIIFGLPDKYYDGYTSQINAVTADDVQRVANKYLDPSKMAIVIVGDKKSIEPGLRELGYPLTYLDADGNTLSQ